MTDNNACLTIADLPFAVVSLDLQGQIIDCNTLVQSLTGYVRAELIDHNINMLIDKEAVFACQSSQQNSSQSIKEASRSPIIQLLDKSQHAIPCEIKTSKMNEGYLLFIEPSHDVDLSLKLSSNDNAQRLVNDADEAFWEWHLEQDLVHYSAQAMALLGYEAKAFDGSMSLWQKHLQKTDLADVYQQIHQGVSGNSPCLNATYAITTKQGKEKWLNLTGKVIEHQNGEAKLIHGAIKEVSEPQELIGQLKKQNGYLHLAERLSHSGHWRYDVQNKQLYWSHGVYAMHRVTQKKYRPTLESAISFYLASEREKIQTLLDNAINKKTGFHFKSTIINALGKRVKVESKGKVELDANQEVVGIFCVIKDITKTEETFEKLKLLAMVNYTIKVPIFFIDDQDNLVYQDLCPQTGSENLVLFNYINFSINDYLYYKRLAKEKGQFKQSSISFDKYITVFDLSVTYEPEEKIYIWIVDNVTDKYRKEQQQIISNRLALLGNTFGNVSHDINNVLGVALGATELLELKVAQGKQDISSYIERVKNAIDKGKDVTERLLAFTRKPAVNMIEFDPIEEIKENQYLFKQLLLNSIDFTCEFDDISCHIKFPQGEFINILLNLVLNAQDAIQEQGLIGKIVLSVHLNDNEQLAIHIKDSGVGIEREDLSKIFDPFYSSKSVNKGNGIGLANVYSTIYKYNGEIQVEGKGELGGAEFILILPCKIFSHVTNKLTSIKSNMKIEEKSVLVLDDEVSIGEFVALFLESEGAKTHYVNTKTALVDVLNSEQQFDIFITDMILPDISGRDAVSLVQEKFPYIKIYSISGYIAEEDNKWQHPVLRKPFNSKELADFLTNY